MRKAVLRISILLLAVIGLSSCNFPRPTPTGEAGSNAVETAAAQTVEAMATQLAEGTMPAQSPSVTSAPAVVTSTPQGGQSSTTSPDGTQQAVATAIPCDSAKFESETIPDGTSELPGATFTKTWTLKNTGSCTWNANYAIVFVSGESFGAPASKQLTTGTVAPGETVQISVDMKAPTTPGEYKGVWKLRNGSGVVFGLGPKQDATFWVDVKVAGSKYSFMDNMCKAEWRSGAGALPCPGSSSDGNGFVIKLDNPELENGTTENEPAIWVHPQSVNNGYITATFPAITPTEGSHLMTVIGCLKNSTNCNVQFILSYKADNDSEQSLMEWNQTADGNISKVNLDLSNLAGKSVQFIFTVKANGSPDADQAFWLMPRIE